MNLPTTWKKIKPIVPGARTPWEWQGSARQEAWLRRHRGMQSWGQMLALWGGKTVNSPSPGLELPQAGHSRAGRFLRGHSKGCATLLPFPAAPSSPFPCSPELELQIVSVLQTEIPEGATGSQIAPERHAIQPPGTTNCSPSWADLDTD